MAGHVPRDCAKRPLSSLVFSYRKGASGQYLMGLDLGGKKDRCLLLDVESGAAVSTCRPWQHRMTAGLGYDLDTVEVMAIVR